MFVDDFSRMTWVYFVKEKPEVLEVFKKFKQAIEKQSGHPLKVLRRDGGGEFVLATFEIFCEDYGIQHLVTLHNKIDWQRGRIVVWWKWPRAW